MKDRLLIMLLEWVAMTTRSKEGGIETSNDT